MSRSKYRFPDRASAEAELERVEHKCRMLEWAHTRGADCVISRKVEVDGGTYTVRGYLSPRGLHAFVIAIWHQDGGIPYVTHMGESREVSDHWNAVRCSGTEADLAALRDAMLAACQAVDAAQLLSV